MKKAVYISLALFLVGGCLFYFLSSGSFEIKGSFPFISKRSDSAVKGASTARGGTSALPASDFFSRTQTAIQNFARQTAEGAKNFFEQAPGVVAQNASNIAGNVEDATRQKAAEVLGVVPADNSNDAQLQVCAVRGKTDAVGYRIENPVFPRGGARYRVVWGDGVTAEGEMKNSEQTLVVSHLYTQDGVYRAAFRIVAASSTFNAERQVCIQ